MNLKNISKEELEIMSYTDITYIVLKENNKPMNTATLFKSICNMLELSEEEYANKIGDYYTSLTIDKRFYMLENAEWDLTEKYKVELQLDDDESEEEETEEEIEEEEEIETEEDTLDALDDDDLDDDTLDLSIVTEDELEEEN